MPTYSGGLGVLAGDIVKSSADLRLQMVAITLASRKGYFKQKINAQGEQEEFPDEWDPSKTLSRMPNTVTVNIEGRQVKVQAWLYEYQSLTGGMVPILFLDTDMEENAPQDRRITDSLYGGDKIYRLKQEIVLGIGGTRLLKKLPFKIRKYHMNEGHSSLLTLELLKENGMDAEKVRNLCVFTTHSPVEAAFDQFSYDLVQQILGNEYMCSEIEQYAGTQNLNMAYLALNLSKYINGVSLAHVDYSENFFQGATSEQSLMAYTPQHGPTYISGSSLTNTFQAGPTNLFCLQKQVKFPTGKSGMHMLRQKLTFYLSLKKPME